jgi:hypothetical protein
LKAAECWGGGLEFWSQHGICLEGLKKTNKMFYQDIEDLKPGFYKARVT